MIRIVQQSSKNNAILEQLNSTAKSLLVLGLADAIAVDGERIRPADVELLVPPFADVILALTY